MKKNQENNNDQFLTPGNIVSHWLKEGECIFSPVEDHRFFKEGLIFLKDDQKQIKDLLLGAIGILKKDKGREGIIFYATVIIQDVSKYIPNSLSADAVVEILDICACKAHTAPLVGIGGEYIIKYSQFNIDFEDVKIELQNHMRKLEKGLDKILLKKLKEEVEPFENALKKEIAQAVQEAKQRMKTIENALASNNIEKRRKMDLKHEHELLEYRIQNKFDGYFQSLRNRIWEILRQLNPLEELATRIQSIQGFIKLINKKLE